MPYGIKISKEKHDVKKCKDKDLIFISQWDFPIFTLGDEEVNLDEKEIIINDGKNDRIFIGKL